MQVQGRASPSLEMADEEEDGKKLVESSESAESDSDNEQDYGTESDEMDGQESGRDTANPFFNLLDGKDSFCEYVSENLLKIVIVVFAISSFLIFALLRRRSDSAALLCIESASKQNENIPYPFVDFRDVNARVDKGPYANLRAEKWIVVAVTGSPTQEIYEMAKLDGWQVLALGDFKASNSWNVPGVIFLSTQYQSALGYRIHSYISESSSGRKNMGYLFAIQHGAKKIYDADARASVIQGTLHRVFDVEITGPESRREPILQYRMVHNRTLINPFVHFGQQSMWPRGFPLSMVSKNAPEISYNEAPPGKQFIQQGIDNGRPDVDSFFYYTRRSEREPVNIEFDPAAPSVALPQGTMVPVNSLNTLFHSPAFCVLMLPVSFSSSSADIVRGYWAQRILWEIGGMLVVYPPTIYRKDRLEQSSSSEDGKEMRNMHRLVNLLISWRSSKRTLFEKILHLSHRMTEEGYLTVQDLQATVAWLQDLVSVGYLQPRLLSLELDRVIPSLYNSDHKQFVPSTLASVYLGIDESSAVQNDMANWLKWREYFGNIVLILKYSLPSNHTLIGWRMLYGRLFKHIVILSKEEVSLGIEKGNWDQAYEAIPTVFDRYPHADGYLYLEDDVILNYWNLIRANKNKLWNLHQTRTSWQVIGFKRTGPDWFLGYGVKKNIKIAIRSLPAKFQNMYRKSMDDMHYVVCSSDIFYIPQRHVRDFRELVSVGVKAQLRHEIAVPLFYMALERPANYDSIAFRNTLYLTGGNKKGDLATLYRKEQHILHPWKVSSESELLRVVRTMSVGDPLLLEVL
ncbi:hypothetical protein O6H91_08G079600 [Diphasiastrum complanatum]|uniref:Uncharacterized protein n=3 Tax=Diphasiastrum complanatum TaxID=34168 RepID=A0ACC2CZ88_DIPCM|nr:hypothetical protein O6H91_08G079600 [Diphasiastrum complanatum]KAJ7547309.1 hypothetical protein O6H91_08G079600 [Diphasiastrum complanatum]KAJ7547311.1 hypothetical protein O6H91_08G079600 [Diphasiastrum complanatum]